MSAPKVQMLLDILDEMWDRDGWIDPLGRALEGWPKEQASRLYAPEVKSVETIVNHTAFWEDVALRRLADRPLDDLDPLDAGHDGNAPAWMPRWPVTVEHFKKIRAGLRAALLVRKPDELSVASKGDDLTREARVYTRAIHSGYHTGQLTLLRQLFKLPQPKIHAKPLKSGSTSPFVGARQMLLDMMDSAWSSGYSIDPYEELVRDLTVDQADWRPAKDVHTIAEIINHMSYWEEYVTRRLRGESTADMPRVDRGGAPSEMPGWPEAKENLLRAHSELRTVLGALSDEELAKPRPDSKKTFEEGRPAQWLVYGVITHHAYHVGQIVTLRELAAHQ